MLDAEEQWKRWRRQIDLEKWWQTIWQKVTEIHQHNVKNYSSTKEESDSDSELSAAMGWKKGISTVHQMNIAHQYWTDNGLGS